MICVGCINCSYNIVAKDIRYLDKIAIFVHTEKIIQVRAFESSFPESQLWLETRTSF